MKKVFNVAFLFILFFGFVAHSFIFTGCTSQATDDHAQESKAANSRTNQLAVDFKAVDLRGEPFSALSWKGKTVLLDFWAVWCGPCIAAFPTLKKLNRDLKDQNFQVVGVAVYSGNHEDVRKFVEKHELDYTVVVGDEELVERFGVIGFPTYFLLSPDGTVQKKYVGEAKNLYPDVKKEVLVLSNAAESRKKRGI